MANRLRFSKHFNKRYGREDYRWAEEITYKKLWIGLRAPPGNGTFKWVGSRTEPSGQGRWAEGYPKLTEGSDACVYDYSGKWYDVNCAKFAEANVVCEFLFDW